MAMKQIILKIDTPMSSDPKTLVEILCRLVEKEAYSSKEKDIAKKFSQTMKREYR